MQATKLCTILKIFLYYKINGYYNQISYNILQQKLMLKEKKSIKN